MLEEDGELFKIYNDSDIGDKTDSDGLTFEGKSLKMSKKKWRSTFDKLLIKNWRHLAAALPLTAMSVLTAN